MFQNDNHSNFLNILKNHISDIFDMFDFTISLKDDKLKIDFGGWGSNYIFEGFSEYFQYTLL